MKPFSLLIKPASADCNLRCDYCFYLEKSSLYPEETVHRMTPETLEAIVSSYLKTPQKQHVFIWQGGEPTLMGVEFFRRGVELQIEHGRNRNAEIANAVQTNGSLVTREMAELFAKYRFLVGVSIDGPPELHDAYRTSASGAGSFNQMLRGVKVLNDCGVATNAMVLISAANVGHARDVYAFLKEKGFLFHQYIPCVELTEEKTPAPYAITGTQWGRFLCDLFDAWLPADVNRVSVRNFDIILNLLARGERTICYLRRDCQSHFVVEYNGDVYPCDFYVRPELKLGNVHTHTWEQILASDLCREFGASKRLCNPECGSCEWFRLCAGDCLKHRLSDGCESPRHLSLLCEGWKRFYSHSFPTFREIARTLKRESSRTIAASEASRPEKPGRNDPCPCGSELKYKKCCGLDTL